MGKHALSSSSLHAGKQGRPPRASAALGRRPWASGTAGVEGERGRATLGFDSPPQFQRRGPVGRSAAAMAVVGRRRPWAAR